MNPFDADTTPRAKAIQTPNTVDIVMKTGLCRIERIRRALPVSR